MPTATLRFSRRSGLGIRAHARSVGSVPENTSLGEVSEVELHEKINPKKAPPPPKKKGFRVIGFRVFRVPSRQEQKAQGPRSTTCKKQTSAGPGVLGSLGLLGSLGASALSPGLLA